MHTDLVTPRNLEAPRENPQLRLHPGEKGGKGTPPKLSKLITAVMCLETHESLLYVRALCPSGVAEHCMTRIMVAFG